MSLVLRRAQSGWVHSGLVMGALLGTLWTPIGFTVSNALVALYRPVIDRHPRPHCSRGVFRFGRDRVPLLLGHPFRLLGIAQVVRRHDLHAILVEHVLDIGVQQAQ